MNKELSKGFTGIEINGVRFSNLGEMLCYMDKQRDHIAELEKENAELKGLKDVATLIRANNDTVTTLMQLNNILVGNNHQLTKAKELLKQWVELYKPKLEGYPITPIQEQTEQFLKEK